MNLWTEEEQAPLLAASLKGCGHVLPSSLSKKDRKAFAGISNSYIILAFWSWASNKIGRVIEV